VVTLGRGLIVLVRFPFSDLSSSKLRPACVLAHSGGPDWILCQITSNPYSDVRALPVTASSFAEGGLPRESYARPSKLFTAHESIVVRIAGRLTSDSHQRIIDAAIRILRTAGDS
jgi:mRNA interferase MazF